VAAEKRCWNQKLMSNHSKRSQLSWAFYDWANSAFATTVMAGFFPVFFKEYWASDLSVSDSTFWLGVGNSVASMLVVVLAPFIGAVADQGGHKKKLLILFAFLGILMSASLYFVASGFWMVALVIYGMGVIGFSSSIVCYDALLVDVTPSSDLDRVSAFGFALGYLGGGLLFALNVVMVLNPAMFGLADASAAVRVAFFMVAIWWAVFSIPVMLYVKERQPAAAQSGMFKSAVQELISNIREIRQYRMAFTFLVAYWLYIDGVDTIVRMAVDYGMAIGFDASDLLTALLVTQFVGFPAALVFGRIGQRYGPKAGINVALVIYVLVVIWAWHMQAVWEFYGLAVSIGLVQGGIQALSRSLYARLIPAERAGAFFGMYNMLGKFAAVLGPLLVGVVSMLTSNPRHGILSVLLLFVAGGLILQRVKISTPAK
jgi:UMF1 family MFS transporter